MREQVRPEDCVETLYRKLANGGVLMTSVGTDGVPNVMTIGWGQFGPFYHGNPIFIAAVTPLRYTWHLLEQVPEFVVAIQTDDMAAAAELCGTRSGRDTDKFKEAGLTPIPSRHVKPPSIAECPVNIECRVYYALKPPHMILTPEHRGRPMDQQHTIYFAEVLGIHAGT